MITHTLSDETNPETLHPCHVLSCSRAIRWILSTTIIDDRTRHWNATSAILIGHSSGAHLASLLLTARNFLTSSYQKMIKGVIGIEGIYDIPQLIQSKAQPYMSQFQMYIDFTRQAFSNDIEVSTIY
jgi:acetyl esterase/lipase